MLCRLAVCSLVLISTATAAAAPCRRPEIHVYKSAGRLDLTCGERVILSAAATFGRFPGTPKRRRADRRTPEGRYVICSKARYRRFHVFLNLDYPNRADVDRAVREKRINGRLRRAINTARRGGRCPRGITPLGSGVGIHGTTRRWAWLTALWQEGRAVKTRWIANGKQPLVPMQTVAPDLEESSEATSESTGLVSSGADSAQSEESKPVSM